MPSRITMTIADSDNNNQTRSFDGIDFAADGSNYVAVLAQQLALRDAILNITLGTLQSQRTGGNFSQVNAPLPTDDFAQTNIEWQFRWQSTLNGSETKSVKVGTADLALAQIYSSPIGNYIGLNLDAGLGQVLKGAFDAYVLMDSGDPAELTGVIYVQ